MNITKTSSADNPYGELDENYTSEQNKEVTNSAKEARKKIFANTKEKLNSIFKNAHKLSLKRK